MQVVDPPRSKNVYPVFSTTSISISPSHSNNLTLLENAFGLWSLKHRLVGPYLASYHKQFCLNWIESTGILLELGCTTRFKI